MDDIVLSLNFTYGKAQMNVYNSYSYLIAHSLILVRRIICIRQVVQSSKWIICRVGMSYIPRRSKKSVFFYSKISPHANRKLQQFIPKGKRNL